MQDLGPSRRDFLALTAVAAVAAPAAFAAEPVANQRLRDFMLVHGALDQRLVIGCVVARYYGVVEGAMMPLFGVAAATFSRFLRSADGGYRGVSFEVPYFTDLDSGLALENWRNPFTGEDVVVPDRIMPASQTAIAPDLTLSAPGAPPGMTMSHRVLAPLRLGDDVWVTEETIVTLERPGLARPIHYSELVTMRARQSELARTDALQVPSEVSYTQVSDWRGWMKMADRPGHLTAHGVGRIGRGLESLPEAWLQATRARRPQLLQDPAAPLASLWETLAH